MKKKLSLLFAVMAMIACFSFATYAYADQESQTISFTGNQNISVSLSSTKFTYSGKENKPGVTVKYTSDTETKTLVNGTDYKVAYSNNINAGTANVKITGIGKFSGVVEKTFKINPLSITSNNISISYSYTYGVYNGKTKTPTATVYMKDGNSQIKLVNNKDYTVSYKNNVNMGKATATVKGIGNFTSSVSRYYYVVPPQTTNLVTYEIKPTSTKIKWNKINGVTGYQVSIYDANTKTYKQIKRVTSNTNSCQITGLTPATNNYFKVRAYITIDNSNYYGSYSDCQRAILPPEKMTLTSVTKNGTTVNVEWKKVRASGYQIVYTTDKNFKKGLKSVTIKGNSKTAYALKKLNKNSTYYVKVRAYYIAHDKKLIGSYSSMLSTYYSNLYATYTSSYVNNANRTTNLRIASKAINGTIVKPGQTFSFNKVVGPRTSAKGYKPAPVFAGSGVQDGLGGGICQVASTMFNTTLLANMQITERHQHNQRVSYVPLGRDAAIYGTVEDFKWKNNTKYPVRIVMTVNNGKITCSFYTCVKAKPAKVSLKVTQSGKNFTLKRYVGGKVNYTCKSKY